MLSRDARIALGMELGNAARISQRASAALDDAIAQFFGINSTDGRAMDVLEQLGPMTAGDLAGHLKVTSGAVTALVDRLERLGFVERVRDTEDRRRVYVQPTQGALEIARTLFGPLKLAWMRHGALLTDEEMLATRTYLRLATAIDAEFAARIRSLDMPADATPAQRLAAATSLANETPPLEIELDRE